MPHFRPLNTALNCCEKFAVQHGLGPGRARSGRGSVSKRIGRVQRLLHVPTTYVVVFTHKLLVLNSTRSLADFGTHVGKASVHVRVKVLDRCEFRARHALNSCRCEAGLRPMTKKTWHADKGKQLDATKGKAVWPGVGSRYTAGRPPTKFSTKQ